MTHRPIPSDEPSETGEDWTDPMDEREAELRAEVRETRSDSGNPNHDRAYLQDVPPADAEDTEAQITPADPDEPEQDTAHGM